jgi:hypothetical protein
MKALHVSTAALLIAVGELLTAIGQKNSPALYASITAILASFLPSVLTWLTPPAPPAPPADSGTATEPAHAYQPTGPEEL